MTELPAKTVPNPTGIDVSVVIPVYNCEKYIQETVESVRAQDMHAGSLEIIAVDDGSTDDSLNILNKLAADCTDLHVHSTPNSGSAAAPRNFDSNEPVAATFSSSTRMTNSPQMHSPG